MQIHAKLGGYADRLRIGERGMNMNCKYCNAELTEETSVCPVCGKEQNEAEETTLEVVENTAEEVAEVDARTTIIDHSSQIVILIYSYAQI